MGPGYIASAEVAPHELMAFSAGRYERLWELLGPQLVETAPASRYRFMVWAPRAHQVGLSGEWSHGGVDAMVRVGDSGPWSAVVPARAGDRYQYRVVDVPAFSVMVLGRPGS
jgi:1,4-alpha-glucan branching enzyme